MLTIIPQPTLNVLDLYKPNNNRIETNQIQLNNNKLELNIVTTIMHSSGVESNN